MAFSKPLQAYVSVIISTTEFSENNLRRCLGSVINQSLKNLEIIIACNNNPEKINDICNEFKTARIKINIIGSTGGSLGGSMNSALKSATGDYIGFIRSNDWVDQEMYLDLYQKAFREQTDIETGFFFTHKDDGNGELCYGLASGRINQVINRRISDRYFVPQFYLEGPYICSAIFNRHFLAANEIYFSKSNDETALYIGFAFSVFCNMKSLMICRKAYYHYNFSDSKPVTGGLHFSSTALLNEHAYISNYIKAIEPDTRIIQIEMARSFRDLKKEFNSSCKNLTERISYLKSSSDIFKHYLANLDENRYMSEEESALFKKIALSPLRTAILNNNNSYIKTLNLFLHIQLKKRVSYLKILKFPIIFIKRTDDYKTFNICNIPIRRMRKTASGDGQSIKIKYFYLGIPLSKRIVTKNEIKTYWFGLRVSRKINFEARLTELENRLAILPTPEEIAYQANLANSVSRLHAMTFPQFKNSNSGNSVAIFGSGPSVEFAPAIEKSKIISCNNAINLFDSRDPDYIFAQDYSGVRDYAEQLLNRKSIVFFGYFQNKSYFQNLSIPENMRLNANVYSYYTAGGTNQTAIRAEIESFPLADFGSIVHPALHFALFTHPKIIYILGCDITSSGYSSKNLIQITNPHQFARMKFGFEKLRDFRDRHYPDTKIISVNPIGLKGIFDDVYTKGFVEAYKPSNHQQIETINII